MTDRVIAHLDLDAFYAQVEVKLNPALEGKPVAVAQYTAQGGLIAVGYEARKHGVKRGMTPGQAKSCCPELVLARVPEANGKANLTRYRDAGSEVVKVISRLAGACERASIDEMFVDVTALAAARAQTLHPADRHAFFAAASCHVVGQRRATAAPAQASEGAAEDRSASTATADAAVCDWVATRADELLAAGALVVADIRAAVLAECGYTVSAGVAHNKMLAKLCSGMNKPNAQTVIPMSRVPAFFATLPLSKIRGLGGKFGEQLQQELGLEFVGDLAGMPLAKLAEKLDPKTVAWLTQLAQGLDDSPVENRTIAKSIACSKNFPGRNALKMFADVDRWLAELAQELGDRLDIDRDTNNRIAKTLSVGVSVAAGHQSRSCALRYGTALIIQDAAAIFRSLVANEPFCVTMLSMGAATFKENIPANNRSITQFFSKAAATAANAEDGGDASPFLQDSDDSVLLDEEPEAAPKSPKSVFLARHYGSDTASNGAPSPRAVPLTSASTLAKVSLAPAARRGLDSYFSAGPRELTCCECFKVLPSAQDLQEHLDHHLAERLQEDDDRERASAAEAARGDLTMTPGAAGRKRKASAVSASDAPQPGKSTLARWLKFAKTDEK